MSMDLRRPQGAAPVIAKPRRSRQRQGDMTGRLLPIAGLLFVVACQPAAPAGPMITLDGVATAARSARWSAIRPTPTAPTARWWGRGSS